jgi:hypothetical protein
MHSPGAAVIRGIGHQWRRQPELGRNRRRRRCHAKFDKDGDGSVSCADARRAVRNKKRTTTGGWYFCSDLAPRVLSRQVQWLSWAADRLSGCLSGGTVPRIATLLLNPRTSCRAAATWSPPIGEQRLLPFGIRLWLEPYVFESVGS